MVGGWAVFFFFLSSSQRGRGREREMERGKSSRRPADARRVGLCSVWAGGCVAAGWLAGWLTVALLFSHFDALAARRAWSLELPVVRM